jgi:cytochrome c oxidase cbb3-type subunit 3
VEPRKRDKVTGRTTTGHIWNGIEELETPIPKVVFAFLAGTFLFAVLCWVLYPAWPFGVSYTKGLLGFDQRNVVTEQVAKAEAARIEDWGGKVEAMNYAQIEADPALMQPVKDEGRRLFEDNCAACHGVKATGGPGFPDLTAKAWLWGGSPETIAETIRVGINGTAEDTRSSQMLSFGKDQMLDREQILNVVAYVRSLSGLEAAADDAARIEPGKEIFAQNCASCHGEDAKGNQELGAPNLTDETWIYGGDQQAVYTTVYNGRQGHMPSWGERLTPLQIKILALYVHTLKAPQ